MNKVGNVSFGKFYVLRENGAKDTKKSNAIKTEVCQVFDNTRYRFNYKRKMYGEYPFAIKETLANYIDAKSGMDVVLLLKKGGTATLQMQKNNPDSDRVTFEEAVKDKQGRPLSLDIQNLNKIKDRVLSFAQDCFGFVSEDKQSKISPKAQAYRDLEMDKWLDEDFGE